MKRIILYIALIISLTGLFSVYSFGQKSQGISFDKNYPFVQNGINGIVSFPQDDGYIMAMAARHYDVFYLTLIRTNLYGDTLWVKYMDIGMETNVPEVKYGVSDPDGNIYITVTHADYSLLKIDPDGNFLWGRGIQNINMPPVFANGSLWLCIKISSNCYMVKLNPVDGENEEMNLLFSNPDWWPSSLSVNDNGDVVIAVLDEFPFMLHYVTNMIFSKPADSTTFSYTILDLQNNFIYLDKMKNSGSDLLGIAHFPVAYSYSFDENFIVRFTASGMVLLDQELSFSADSSFVIDFVINSEEQALLLCWVNDNSSRRYELLCMDTTGTIAWSKTLPDHVYQSINNCNDGGYIITGEDSSANDYPFLLKTDSQGIVSVDHTRPPLAAINTFPVPATKSVTFDVPGMQHSLLTICDVYGKPVTYVEIRNGQGQLNTLSLKPGVYFCTSDAGVSCKIIITK
ncbi:MAG TPA: hypothetical protein VK179_13980 [Bacteroidales bacterium]|nr:hypothetical protein [Bacteroidales bacterium]